MKRKLAAKNFHMKKKISSLGKIKYLKHVSLKGNFNKMIFRMKYFGGWKMFWKIYECMSDNTELKIGDALPDGIEIFDIQSKTFKSLSDVINQEKTTILNFGSCT